MADKKTTYMPLLTLNDLESASRIFRGRLGNILGSSLMSWLSVDRVNCLYDRNFHRKGPDFTEAVLSDLGLEYELLHAERLKDLPSGPFITISNHPYGSIDGVLLVDIFGHLRPDYKVMVNGFLSRVRTLEDNFICVTPTGNVRRKPSGDTIHGVRESLEHVRDGHPMGIFPSGAVSDLSLKDGCVRDRPWQEPVIRLIQKMNVPIVPVHFLDRNSDLYYTLGLIDWRVRLLRFPAEVFNKRGERTRVAIGPIITPARQQAHADFLSDFLRDTVYNQY